MTTTKPPTLWDRLPGEPEPSYSLFLEWCILDPAIDAGDWYRGTVSKRPPVSRPSWEDYGEIVNRWFWLRRQAAFRERLLLAKARRLSRVIEREEAASAALEWASRSMGVAVRKLDAWEAAPATVDDRLALGLVAEHRQRQRDSGEISRTPEVVVVAPPMYDLRGASKEELDAMAELEERLARFRVKPGA